MIRLRALLACIALLIGGMLIPAAAQTAADVRLAAALAQEDIKVNVNFSGALITLFAMSDYADDPEAAYAIVLSGPRRPFAVTRQGDNKARFNFVSAPTVLSVAAEPGLEDIATPQILIHSGANARYTARPAAGDLENPALAEWRDALTQLQTEAGLYVSDIKGVTRLRGGLLRADINLPAAAPPGEYDVRIFVFLNGVLSAEAAAPLSLTRHGAEDALFSLSRRLPVFYGILAVCLGCAVGALGAVMGSRNN